MRRFVGYRSQRKQISTADNGKFRWKRRSIGNQSHSWAAEDELHAYEKFDLMIIRRP